MHKISLFNLKAAFAFLAILSLCACTKSGSESSSSNVSSSGYTYGTLALPGSLPALASTYRPLNLSSKIFSAAGVTYAPMNLIREDLGLRFDVALQKASAHALIDFETSETSHPYFQLQPQILSAKLDGAVVATTPISDPDGAHESYVSLSMDVAPGRHQLELEYQLSADSLSFQNDGIAWLTDMTDLTEAHYFEAWGPAGFEDDAFEMSLDLEILNSTATHQLFTNGQASLQAPMHWQIRFPEYFTTSSFYVHLTNKALLQESLSIQGSEKIIPVTLYATTQTLIDQAKAALPDWFREYERDFGTYPHASFTAYLQPSGGGMEYSGATISSIGALDHELFHSWFARGVMPAEGRAGWIDEAFASWRDNDYFQAPSLLSRAPTLLANFSPFEKSTPANCYRDGRQLIAELDRVFAEFGGMKPLMRLFFQRYNHRVVTTEEFWNFLNVMTAINVDAYFERYTMGQATAQDGQAQEAQTDFPDSQAKSKHPAALTKSEVEALR